MIQGGSPRADEYKKLLGESWFTTVSRTLKAWDFIHDDIHYDNVMRDSQGRSN